MVAYPEKNILAYSCSVHGFHNILCVTLKFFYLSFMPLLAPKICHNDVESASTESILQRAVVGHYHQNAWAAKARSADLIRWECPVCPRPFLADGGCGAVSHQSGAATCALDVRVVFSSAITRLWGLKKGSHLQQSSDVSLSIGDFLGIRPNQWLT